MDERYASLSNDLTPLPNEYEIQALSGVLKTLTLFIEADYNPSQFKGESFTYLPVDFTPVPISSVSG